MEYKKINLRKFRHNLTQLKDSLEAGQAYEVLERGKPLAYFIPADYKIEIKNDEEEKQKRYEKVTKELFGIVKMTDEERKNFDPDAIYRKAMEEKHLK
jgi:antitoxin (DNA-binding transcriptional repressor) of toxin-antitoxin stability system